MDSIYCNLQQLRPVDVPMLTGIVLALASAVLLFSKSKPYKLLCKTDAAHIYNYLQTVLWMMLCRIWGASCKYSHQARSKRFAVQETGALKELHEVAEILHDLVLTDGAGHWPPAANHDHASWPKVLQPYSEIYRLIAPLLPQALPSLDNDINQARIEEFRKNFRWMLEERIDLVGVTKLFEATGDGRHTFPGEVYNAVYNCIAISRHAYRWATIPVVRVAQIEKELDFPKHLVVPWTFMQRHFGCTSDSGNNTSNLILNFDTYGSYTYKINTGMPQKHLIGEEAFARIFYDVEVLGFPIYLDMVHAIVAFAKSDYVACARHVAGIVSKLRPVLSSYFDNMHDKVIARSVWLSHIQGFQAWGIGPYDRAAGEWEKFDGLSGNQVLFFQALDAFLGIEQYLSPRDQQRNMPERQRVFCHALRKHSFRKRLLDLRGNPAVEETTQHLGDIIGKLRLFRAAHRTRAKTYLTQPAPERMHMTAGKSLLRPSLDDSLASLDEFMVRRLAETV